MSRNIDDKQIIDIIAEIDRLKIIQAQHITEGNLERALEVSNIISELAKKINSQYIIDDNQDYLSNVSPKKEEKPKSKDIKLIGNDLNERFNDLIEMGNVVEAHELVENFKKKYGSNFNLFKLSSVRECIEKDHDIWQRYLREQENKVVTLDELENNFFLSIKTKDMNNASKVIEKAWDNIYKLEGEKKEIYQNRWGTLEHNLIQGLKYEEYDIVKNTNTRIKKVINESTILEKGMKFDKAINMIQSELDSKQIDDMVKLKMELEIRLADIQTSKTLAESTNKNIDYLKNQLQRCLKNDVFDEAMNYCNEIIELSKKHGLKELREEHELLLKDVENSLTAKKMEEELKKEEIKKFENLKETVLILNKEGLDSLSNHDVAKALDKYKEIKKLISNHIR